VAPTADVFAARTRLEDAVHRVVDVVRSAPNLHQTVADGRWTIRDTTAHLTVTFGLYTEFAAGATTSPYQAVTPEVCTAVSEQLFADVSEDDPERLTGLLLDSAERFLDETSGLPGDHPVVYHCGLPYNVFGLTGTLLGDVILHGYDIAARLRLPWRIGAGDATLVLAAYAPLYCLIVDPDRTKGLNVAVSVDLGDGGPAVARFGDGEFGFEEPGGEPVDATISADPVAFLMVASGRLDRSAAIALGLMELGGPRPDVAMAFPDYFAYP